MARIIQHFEKTGYMIAQYLSDSIDVSHCVLVVDFDGELGVIQCVSQSLSGFDGIQAQPLSEFIKNSLPYTTIALCYRAETSTVQSYVDQAYILLEQKLPFDDDFELDNGENLYCSEFLYKILPEEFSRNYMILKGHQKILSFDSFLNEQFFEVLWSRPDEQISE